MSSNRAFIEAFRSSPLRPAPEEPRTSPAPAASFTWGSTIHTSEYLGGDVGLGTSGEVEPPVDKPVPPERDSESIFRFGPPVVRRPKRPLASILRDGDSTGSGTSRGPAVRAENAPRWPSLCQQLLGLAAYEYDALLRTFKGSVGVGLLTGVMGVAPKSGCSTTATCLALRSAALGKSTLLVDADWKRPTLASMLDLHTYQPWGSLLHGGMPVLQGVVPESDAGVDLLLNASDSLHAIDAATTFRLGLAAGAMRRKYESTIFDFGYIEDDHSRTDLVSALGLDQLLLVAGPESSDTDVEWAQRRAEGLRIAVSGIFRAA